jgi:hypothetical protein
MSRNEADEAVSVVSIISSSIYLQVRFKASVFFVIVLYKHCLIGVNNIG